MRHADCGADCLLPFFFDGIVAAFERAQRFGGGAAICFDY